MSRTIDVKLPAAPREVHVKGAPRKKNEPKAEEMDALLQAAYHDGYRRATGEWTARLSEVLNSLDREAAGLTACRQEVMDTLEKNVIDLSLAVAEKFLFSEIERREYGITAIVNALMERLDGKGGRLTVALNPEDHEALDAEGLTTADAFTSIRLMADGNVPPAGCRLDSPLGRVTFSLEEQMKEIRHMLAEMEVPENDGRDDEYQPAQADPEAARAR